MPNEHKARIVPAKAWTVPADEFKHYFKVDLKKFCNPVTGFDVISFDEKVIKPKGDESTADAITAKYGERATALIHELINMKNVYEAWRDKTSLPPEKG